MACGWQTRGGGLAMVRTSGGLQVVNLADGAIRWSRETEARPGPGVSAGMVIFGANGRVTGDDDRHGTQRWTVTGVPVQPMWRRSAQQSSREVS